MSRQERIGGFDQMSEQGARVVVDPNVRRFVGPKRQPVGLEHQLQWPLHCLLLAAIGCANVW